MSLEFELQDAQEGTLTRAWQGYLGTGGAEVRVPNQIAWRILTEASLEGAASEEPDPEDRTLLSKTWSQSTEGFERPWYATRALLEFASRAGSADVLPFVLEQLDSKDSDFRSLAVDAIASITGLDLRRGPDGAARPLDEVVTAYRNECAAR